MIINLIILFYFILCITVCIYDIRYRTIPNKTIKIIFFLSIITSVYQGYFLNSTLYFIYTLVTFLIFWYLGLIGGGDVKAICSFTIGIKPDLIVFYFISIGLIGAVQVMFMLTYDYFFKKSKIKIGIPYGIPISISGVILVFLSLVMN